MSTGSFDPIETGFSPPPEPYPLGFPIKDKVTVEPIRKQLANQVHKSHHSYVATDRHNSIVNHGVFVDGQLAGAISYGYLLCSSPIRGYEPDEYIEVARATMGIDMPNLASCSMGKSQEQFAETYAKENDIGLLVTYVHEDYEGSMFKALRGKGWEYDGMSEGHQAGNREYNEIRDVDKSRWVCELE